MMMNAMQQATLQQHRRVRSLGSSHTTGNERDEDLVLFHEMQKRERAAVSSPATQTLQRDPSAIMDPRNKAVPEDIFTSSEWDKNDYDWLLTPPATPLIPNLDHDAVGNGYSLSGAASAKSLLKTTSRLGMSRSEPPSRAEPVSRIVRGSLGLQQPANNNSSLSSSTNSISRKSLPSSTNASSRPSTPSSNGRSSAPISQPPTRPSTPTRTAGAPRVSTTSSSSTNIRPSTPTGRSAIISSTRASSSSGPSLVRSASTSASASSVRAASASPSTVATRPGGSSSRASTPVKRPATPTRTANPPTTITRSSSVSKTSTLPQPKIAASSRPSSPVGRVRQPAAHPAVLPGFSQEPPPNLRTSMPDRPLSNSRGSVASRASGTRPAQPEVKNDRSLRLSGSPLTMRGRLSSDSLNSEKSLGKAKPHDTLQTALSNGIQSKMVDRTVSTKKSVVLPEKPSAAISSQVKKPVKSSPIRDLKSTTLSARESTGFGRNLSKKSLDMALRHMTSVYDMRAIELAIAEAERVGTSLLRPTVWDWIQSALGDSTGRSLELTMMGWGIFLLQLLDAVSIDALLARSPVSSGSRLLAFKQWTPHFDLDEFDWQPRIPRFLVTLSFLGLPIFMRRCILRVAARWGIVIPGSLSAEIGTPCIQIYNLCDIEFPFEINLRERLGQRSATQHAQRGRKPRTASMHVDFVDSSTSAPLSR
ncbi:hypothetical protein L7F22_055866 [Adiantum nelumboides]|nr:hypothetical protein [Adiantum nelumboides]